MKKIYILLFTLLLFGKLHAQTWDGSVSDDWNNMDNWTPANVPTATSLATIPGGLMGVPYPKLSSNVTIKSINMTAGSEIDFNGFILNINNLNTYPAFNGAKLKNSDATKDIVINFDAGSDGYTASFSSNIVDDAITFNISGANTFYVTQFNTGNDFNFDVIFNINGSGAFSQSNNSADNFDGNLTVNRNAAGTTNLFITGSTVAGNFAYTNNVGGGSNFGNVTTATNITGKIDISINNPTIQPFTMRKIVNSTSAGIINVQKTQGFTVENNSLKIASIDISGINGNAYAYFLSNTIVGNVNVADDAGNNTGYATYIYSNTITGTSLFTVNGTNQFYEASTAGSANHFIGNTTFSGTSSGQINISEVDKTVFDGNVTIDRSVSGTTYAFSAGPTINGDFIYTNNVGGATYLGDNTIATNITGTINITSSYNVANKFEMLSLKNTTTGGNINVTGSQGFNVRNNNLKLSTLSLLNYSGNEYGYFMGNTFVGALNIAPSSAYSNGYISYVRGNTITGLTTITVDGTNTFYEGDIAGDANHYIGNVIINGISAATISVSNTNASIFDGNLTINRTITAGTTDAFNSQPAINGNFTYVNEIGGNSLFGHASLPTTITGKIDITVTDPIIGPATFEMTAIKNLTAGGIIAVKNSKGFNVRNNDLKVASIGLTGYRSNDYGYFLSNIIVGNVTIEDDASYAGGYITYINTNTITGLTNVTINGSNVLNEADGLNSANHYIGNVVFTGTSSATLFICKTDDSIFDGNITINRTGVAGETNAFDGQGTINGNLIYNNLIGGNSFFGHATLPTTISGTIKMTATYPNPAIFEMLNMTNQTTGESILVTDSRGFNVSNCNLKVTLLSIESYKSNAYAVLANNIIEGNATFSDHSTYNGGYSTTTKNNTITGNTSYTINGANQFYDNTEPASGNKYIGDVSYFKLGGPMSVATNTAANEISGNLLLSSNSGLSIGKLIFNGAANSIIDQTGSQLITLTEMTVDKTGTGKVDMFDNITITGALNLTNGVIYNTANIMLILNNNVAYTGGSNTSYIDGQFRKMGNQAFTFPVGSNGYIAPISISTPPNMTDGYTAQYKAVNPTTDGFDITQKAGTLDHILDKEYWLLDGNSPVFVTLGWNALRSGQVNPLASSRVAHWNGTSNTWEDKGNSATTGNANNGTVKTGAAIPSFSPFAIASTEPFLPLPLTLISFSGKNTENGNQLNWQTADEKAFSHFEIERSTDAKKFEKIGEVNSFSSENYEYLDRTPPSGVGGLYRLKMVDLDGKFKYSKIINIENAKSEEVTIFPNPSVEYFSVKNANNLKQIQLIDLSGKLVRNFEKNAANIYKLNGLEKGLYILRIKTENNMVNSKLFVE